MIPESMEQLDRVKKDCTAMLAQRANFSAGASAFTSIGTSSSFDVKTLCNVLTAINESFGLTPKQLSSLDNYRKSLVCKALEAVGNKAAGVEITESLVTTLMSEINTRSGVKNFVRWMGIVGKMASAAISYRTVEYIGSRHISDCYEVVRKYLESVSENAECGKQVIVDK